MNVSSSRSYNSWKPGSAHLLLWQEGGGRKEGRGLFLECLVTFYCIYNSWKPGSIKMSGLLKKEGGGRKEGRELFLAT